MKRSAPNIRTFFCREGIWYSLVIAFAFFAALLKQVNATMLFTSLLVCPLFISLWLSRRILLKLAVKRSVPLRIHAGDTFVTQLELSNPRDKISAWGIIIEDDIAVMESGTGDDQPNYRPAVYFDYVRANDSKRKSYIGRLPERGRYRFGKITLSTRFPCGFFRSSVDLDIETEMLVLPKIGTLAAGWMTRQHEASETVLHRRLRPSRVTGEFLGVRGWQHGDTKRWIHWRASARHDQLVVKQYEQHQNHDAAILLDLYCPANKTPQFADDMELAVSFAATLAADIIRRGGCNLTFGAFQETTEIFHGPSNTALLDQILDRLAVLRLSSTDCLADMLAEALANTEPNADLILISPTSVDFTDMTRFGKLKNDPRLRTLMQRVRIVTTSDEAFDKIFNVAMQ
ncbi:MAG: DUF58 domain-containing protein [Planctomycetaceae bacterium]|nr:DUF58 domain-containing protein [Planctomycetaceae bacterium]